MSSSSVTSVLCRLFRFCLVSNALLPCLCTFLCRFSVIVLETCSYNGVGTWLSSKKESYFLLMCGSYGCFESLCFRFCFEVDFCLYSVVFVKRILLFMISLISLRRCLVTNARFCFRLLFFLLCSCSWSGQAYMFLPPKGDRGFLMSPSCLESQGCQFDPTFLYFLFCSSVALSV